MIKKEYVRMGGKVTLRALRTMLAEASERRQQTRINGAALLALLAGVGQEVRR